VTDSISNYFFTTTPEASNNLLQQGIKPEQLFFVGNTMIDTLLKHQSRFKKPDFFDDYNLKAGQYIVLTIHRPSNVDDEEQLQKLLSEIIAHSEQIPLVFPVHPRTRKTLEKISLPSSNLILTEPLSYLAFNYLVQHAKAVITDSGGITEETTVMQIPCMTLRNTTERPETCTLGTNELLGTDPKHIAPALKKLFAGEWKQGRIPEKWDGKTATRIVEHLLALNLPS
jgi:UDP-N-acetylglucosamine 2-epimerase (non-hydrolysing)